MGESMSAGFELMCMENTEEGFFCAEKMQELQNTGAFSEDNPSDAFPDLCAINCDTATGKAIKALGCCAAAAPSSRRRSSPARRRWQVVLSRRRTRPSSL